MHIDKDTFSPMFTEETIRVRQQCFNRTLNALAEPAEEVHFADVVCNNGLFSLYKIDPILFLAASAFDFHLYIYCAFRQSHKNLEPALCCSSATFFLQITQR
jgi:hypothetical protein